MGIQYASVVDHPVDEVFAWHSRPGAMRRLIPPWQTDARCGRDRVAG